MIFYERNAVGQMTSQLLTILTPAHSHAHPDRPGAKVGAARALHPAWSRTHNTKAAVPYSQTSTKHYQITIQDDNLACLPETTRASLGPTVWQFPMMKNSRLNVKKEQNQTFFKGLSPIFHTPSTSTR